MDLTNVFEAVITLAVVLTTAFLIPAIKKTLPDKQLATLNTWINIAVSAAEQIFSETGQGEAKKQYVLNFLESKGYTVNTDEVDLMIESAVNKLTKALRE